MVSFLNRRNLVPSRVETLKIIVTKRNHVVTLTAGSLVSPLNRVPIEAGYVNGYRFLKKKETSKVQASKTNSVSNA